MRNKKYDCRVQHCELCRVGETAYFQAFLDEYENRFHNEPRNYGEYVRYRLPIAFGVDFTLEQVAEKAFSDVQAKQILTDIINIVDSVNIYSDEEFS